MNPRIIGKIKENLWRGKTILRVGYAKRQATKRKIVGTEAYQNAETAKDLGI